MTNNRTPMVDAATLQHAAIGHASAIEAVELRFPPNHHSDTTWFDTAALGLFVHWGISAVNGEVDLSWGMMAGKPWETAIGEDRTITPETYFELAGQFQPPIGVVDQWLPAAAEAGFRYAVFTTRHHDGYALWPSAVGAFNTKLALGGRDLVAEFVESCRRNHLKVGLYYSPPDWYYNRSYMSFHYGSAAGSGARSFAGRAHYGLQHEPIELTQQPDGWHEEFLSYVREQIIELLTRYGKIDMLWFDGGRELSDAISIEEIRALQPGILVNTRMHGVGDFATPECHLPQERPSGRWEHCNIWAEGPWWAHIRSNEQYRSTSWMLSILSQVRAWGGNFLVNIGPRADGSLPADVPARFAELQEWLRHSGKAIYEVTAGPYPERSNVPVTCNECVWYCHLLPGTEGRIVLERPPATPLRATLLRTGSPLEIVWGHELLTIVVPDQLRSPLVDVVAVDWTPD